MPQPDRSPPPAQPDANDLRLLELEYQYLTESSFHSDELRDRFIQFYLILVGAAFTVMLGLAQIQNLAIHPAVFAIIAFFLSIVGIAFVGIFIRLRRVVWESLLASALIKEYFKRHSPNRTELANALLWDQSTVPGREVWYSATSLLALLVILLDSAMLGAAIFFLDGAPTLGQGQFPINDLILALAVFLISAWVQWYLYFWRLEREKEQVRRSSNLCAKFAHFGIHSPLCEELPARANEQR